jgi:hypothetical protein
MSLNGERECKVYNQMKLSLFTLIYIGFVGYSVGSESFCNEKRSVSFDGP